MNSRTLIRAMVASLTLIVFLLPQAVIQASPAPEQTSFSALSASRNAVSSAETVQVIRVPADVGDLQSAIDQVVDGGVIELAGGTYPSPAGGFRIHNLHKGFTIRAAEGSTVTIDGGGGRDLFRVQNTSVSEGGPVTFEGINFANGYTTVEGTAAGLTIFDAEATFIDCVFRNNFANVSTTVGGAVYVAGHSTVFFFDSLWENNSSRFGGAGLGIRSNATVYVHNSRFLSNHANPQDHVLGASGGAISVGNSDLRISNTRFEGNQAGAYGGALYIIGEWQEPLSNLRADVILANTTFENNHATRHSSVNASFPTEGGAVNVEDQSRLRVYHSHFVNNSAMIGGGINVYRSSVEVYKSVFEGNRATGTVPGASFGGAISLNSSDVPDDGYHNWPSAQLLVEDTLIAGNPETVVAQAGGGIFASGDTPRIDGDPAVPDGGTVEQNRVKVDLRRVVFYDCDVASVAPSSGAGGALFVTIADLTMEDSLVLNSDARDESSSGGGVAILYDSVAAITNSAFAYNTTGGYGGGIFAQGSHVDVSDSAFVGNEVSPGVSEAYYESFGAALFSTPDTSRNISARGLIERNEFANNVGMVIFDDDRSTGPINDVRYNDNDFYETTFQNSVYRSSLSGAQDPLGLNGLVINRSNGTSTDKSTVDNTQYSEEPVVVGYASAPQEILYVGAAGDPSTSRTAYVALAWNRGEALLNSTELTERVHLQEISTPGTYWITVEDESYPVEVGETSSPDADFNIQTGDGHMYLNWDVTEGDFIEVAIDQGLTITSQSSGSIQVPAEPPRNYSLYVLTEEGGVVKRLDTSIPRLSAPEDTFYLVELGSAITGHALTLRNAGGSVLNWTATTTTPDLITLKTPSGQCTCTGELVFDIDVSGRSNGVYTGYIDVDGGIAGSQTIEVEIKVVDDVFSISTPLIMRY